ncbi:tetratricopeptide repeat protein [Diaphorobacter sp. LR2014-1]|uniref:O-linked N-acetylglucosamine transferase, SPINDLY family protein n=1 Tax=Diaphorobacter sp. LR2014-1 TaxID=1933219 RepID=UPI000D3FE56A|nr:tetratricopeptide repeat protein [Diaphorobacter sp. LR2014-1]POR08136.1 acetylglucosamine transferase [Diaphorobacter sp. LR2014-1]
MSERQNIDYATAVNLVWLRQMEFAQLLEYADQLAATGSPGLIAVLYRTWLERRPDSPCNPFAWFNLGTVLFGDGDVDGAGQAYEQALALMPDFVQPRFNLGLVRERQGRVDDAIAQWQLVQEHADPGKPEQRPILISALNNQARVQEGRKQFGDAMECLNRSLALEPGQTDVLHHWIFIRAKQCLWPVYEPPAGVSLELLRNSTSALALLSLSDDPQKQLETARGYAQRKLPANLPRLAPQEGYRHEKIRIGYCSSDFCLHPVSMLIVELLELHDRAKFEVYGFCWSPHDGSALRQRVVNAFDHYVDIRALNEEAAARLIRAHEIDILIDLQGQTAGARMHMLALRPAPVQVTYLGLPATTGMSCIDYVIADRFLIPEEYAGNYSEKPIYMPDVYQVSDRKRLCAPAPTRKHCGLPAEGFVFCSFNNNYKYTPEVFDAWMNILRRVPGSVLWLLSDNPWAQASLQREAAARGMAPERLVFAERALPEQYLARYVLPDLFLDTFPFNAGTTANDALWMGVPVLTLTGRSFAARMAGALLTAAGLPELITYDLQAYEDKAVELATTPGACLRLREHLEAVRANGVLFDTPRFARNLEQELIKLLPQKSQCPLNESTE